jgi:hypothetical protein
VIRQATAEDKLQWGDGGGACLWLWDSLLGAGVKLVVAEELDYKLFIICVYVRISLVFIPRNIRPFSSSLLAVR